MKNHIVSYYHQIAQRGMFHQITDDILSLRNFLCNFVTFWSSQSNLSSKKNMKTEENAKS